MAMSLLGSATSSVLAFVRTELRTMLAIGCGDQTDTAMHLASRWRRDMDTSWNRCIRQRDEAHFLAEGEVNERAWKDHLDDSSS